MQRIALLFLRHCEVCPKQSSLLSLRGMSEAIQFYSLDCFVANAPRNDEGVDCFVALAPRNDERMGCFDTARAAAMTA